MVGSKLWPTFTAKTIGLMFFVFAALSALGGLVQVNPVWLYGPFVPAAVSAGSQPDWYLGWLEGALRVMPPWEIRAFGFEVPNPFYPGVLLPGLFFSSSAWKRRFSRRQTWPARRSNTTFRAASPMQSSGMWTSTPRSCARRAPHGSSESFGGGRTGTRANFSKEGRRRLLSVANKIVSTTVVGTKPCLPRSVFTTRTPCSGWPR